MFEPDPRCQPRTLADVASVPGNAAVNPRILLIEDDHRLAEMVTRYLGEFGFSVTASPSGGSGIGLHTREGFDAVILDLMLPDMDGLEVCRRLRAGADTPILMLTARGDATDRIVGLEMGADDYLPKPFEPRELLARLRSILRRTKGERHSEVLRFGRLEIDADARQVRLDGEPRALTGYQFALLLALAQRAGRVMSREALMDMVKNERLEAFDRSIDVHISRIRAAIEDDPKKPHRVITVRGAGYVFAKAQE
jgi:two-component system, OmpR family, phosphate regulon response regulator OmpR